MMKTTSKFVLGFILCCHQIQGMSLPTTSPSEEAAYIDPDPHFSLNLANLEDMEISRTLQTISGAVMGTAEIALGIKSDLKLLRKEIMMGKMNMRFEGRHNPDATKIPDALDNSTVPELGKESTEKIITTNFIRILSAMLIHGPPSTQRRKDDILKLMKTVLNGELDFTMIVEKLPFILRESEVNQFIVLIQTIKEDEFPKLKSNKNKNKGRQEDEDDDGEDDATVAPVVAPVAAPPPEFQETVIFLPRPNGEGSQTQNVGDVSVSNPGGPPVPGSNRTSSATVGGQMPPRTQTQAPLRIVVRQPQPKPAPTLPTTKKPRTQFQKITDAVGQLNVNQFQGLIDSIPDLFAGIDGLVDGVEGIIGDQPSP